MTTRGDESHPRRPTSVSQVVGENDTLYGSEDLAGDLDQHLPNGDVAAGTSAQVAEGFGGSTRPSEPMTSLRR